MTRKRRFLSILLIGVAVMPMSAFTGRFFFGKWTETSDSDISRGYATPQAFAPVFQPSGDWLVFIEGAEGLEDELGRWLSQRLASACQDVGEVHLVKAIPDGPQSVNRLHVKVQPSSRWTPFYATYGDSVEIRYSNLTLSDWPSSPMAVGEVTSGELHVRGSISGVGKAFGIIGRPYLLEHRAKVLADLITKAIADSYEEVRAAAMKAR